MSPASSIALGEIMASKSGSVDPSKFPDEVFDLYSIPAFDSSHPEVVAGRAIGSAKQVVRPGDVLLSRIVPHIRRSWVVANGSGRRIIASGEWIVFRSDRVHPDYLRHVLVGDPFHAQFMNTVAGVGGSLLRARLEHVGKIKIPLPPLAEQRRIAEVLDRAEALRAKRRAALSQLDTLTQSIFLDLFGDPATNPKGWPMRKLEEVCELENGDRSANYPSGDEIKNEGILFLSTKNIVDDALDLSEAVFISEAKFRSLSRGKARRKDLIITLRGTLGSCCIFDCKYATAFINAQMMIIRPKVDGTEKYLHALMTSRRTKDHFARVGYGAAVRQLSSSLLSQLAIPFPAVALQREFARRVAAVEKMNATHRASLAELDALFGVLQYRAFRGEL